MFLIQDKKNTVKNPLVAGSMTGFFNAAQQKPEDISEDLLEDDGLNDIALKKVDEVTNRIENNIDDEDDECKLEGALKSANEILSATAAEVSKSSLNKPEKANTAVSKFGLNPGESKIEQVKKSTDKAIEKSNRKSTEKKHKHPKVAKPQPQHLLAHLQPKPPEMKPKWIIDQEEAEKRGKKTY